MHNTPIYIAYADDHEIVRKGVIEFIHQINSRFHIFIEASTGKELLEKIGLATRQPDVCLLDISMPEMNGYETMQELRQKYPFIRTLAFTIYNNSDFAILKMLSNGALGYVTKNARAEELGEAILQVYQGKYFFCSDVLQIFPRISKSNTREYLEKLLSEREVEFLALCCSDMSYSQIGQALGISTRTAETYAYKLSEKLKIHSRVGLALYAQYSGIGTFSKK